MTLQQTDSIHVGSTAPRSDSVASQHVPLTPARVLSWLPRDATPAQQDSAIQAHFKPSEIQWSKRPDTLHLPGHDKGHNPLDIHLPQYYREGFFSKDTLFHPELPGGRYGIAGDPVPYSAHNDNVLTSILLSLFIMAVIAFSYARQFFLRETKSFFYPRHDGTTEVGGTATEVQFQLFPLLLTCLLLSLLFYFYTLENIGDTFILDSQYHLIAIYLAMTIVYFLFKICIYTIVNIIFFSSKKNVQWIKTIIFITSIEGIMLSPIVLLHSYFNMSMHYVLISIIAVLTIVKILTIYRCFIIFFMRNVVKLQIILYLCTLEIIPLLAFWGSLVTMADNLKINI